MGSSEFLSKGLEMTRRRRKWLVALAAAGVSCYGAYKVYHLPYVVNKRRRLIKVFKAFICFIELMGDSAETLGLVSRELKEFMQSDSDEIPNSLKQVAKIARSHELSVSVVRMSEALSIGLLRGYQSYQLKESRENATVPNVSFTDRIMDKIMSKSGTGFVSAVVGSFATNLVLGVYACDGVANKADGTVGSSSRSNSSDVPAWVTLVCGDQCRQVMANCIQTFVSTAVEVYLDKTMDINVYDDLFKAMTNPSHQQDIRETLVSVCNGAVETLVKTSHKVLTASSSDADTGSSSLSNSGQHEDQSFTKYDSSSQQSSSNKLQNQNSFNEMMNSSGWIGRVTSTLAVPSNRKLVLDVTGRVTSETVRSIVDFTLWKLSDGMKRSIDLAHGEVVDRGREALRYFNAKSAIIFTVCLALYLHILGATKGLVHA